MASPNDISCLTHPLAQRDLTLLRDQNTPIEVLRSATRRLARMLALHSLADVRTQAVAVQTPMEQTAGIAIAEAVTLVPVLRAGLSLLEGFLDMIPEARVRPVGLARDEQTLQPTCYMSKLTTLTASEHVFVLDPMLATGGSAVFVLDQLKAHYLTRSPTFVCILAAPEGIERIRAAHPDVTILTVAVDRQLDEHGFIRPGLGDAGDRLFGA